MSECRCGCRWLGVCSQAEMRTLSSGRSMHYRNRQVSASVCRFCFSHYGLVAAIAVCWLANSKALAQESNPVQLRLGGVMPGGLRKTPTESWGAYELQLTNLTDTDRWGRVLISYAGRADEQYGRDVWVPAHSALSTWMLVGPAPGPSAGISSDIQVLLRQPSEGTD